MPNRKHSLTSSAPRAIGEEEFHEDLTRIYLDVLRQADPSRTALLAEGYGDAEIDHLMATLVRRGLVRARGVDHWQVIPPDLSLPALAEHLEQRARYLRSNAQAVSSVYLRAQYEHQSTEYKDVGIQPLASVEEMVQAMHQVTSTAQEWILSSRADSPLSHHLLRAPRGVTTTPYRTSRGGALDVRLIVFAGLVTQPAAEDILAARASVGDQIRVAAGVAFTSVINDRNMAIVDLGYGDHEESAIGVQITNASAVLTCRKALETIWRSGLPWQPDADGDPDEALDPRDQRILRLMSTGASDAAIARQVGVSSRTVERRIRALMDQLNASTRFQAGVLAGRRGLI